MFTPAIGTYAKALFNLLPTAVRERAVIAGGALRAFFDHTTGGDVDLFFRSDADFVEACRAMRSHVAFEYVGPKGRTEVFRRRGDGLEFNLIGFAFDEGQATADRFDFRCCRMAAWIGGDGSFHFYAAPGAINDAVTRTLIVLVNNGTARTFRRIAHYLDDYQYRFDISLVDHLQHRDVFERNDFMVDVPERHGLTSEQLDFLVCVPDGDAGY